MKHMNVTIANGLLRQDRKVLIFPPFKNVYGKLSIDPP